MLMAQPSVGGQENNLVQTMRRIEGAFSLVIMTERGLNAVINNQVKLGADASIAVGPKGAGIEGATTTALNADIYSFSLTRGLFGGISFEGSLIYKRDDWNQQYYGQPVAPREIVIDRKVSNPRAEPLRAALVVR